MNNKLKCPNCGQEIEITEVIREQVKNEVAKSVELKIKKEVEAEKEKELTLLKDQLSQKDKKLEDAQKEELSLRKLKNELEEEKRTFDLKLQRQLDAERETIRQKTTLEMLDAQKLKEKEKDKVIEDLKNALDDAQRRANQGSQQLQGEVQELDLEETLRTNFPTDIIEPVGKGVRGADIRQIVKTSRGNVCGVILWESKRTKQWSDEWLTKLKDDLRAEKANIPIIVSTVLPKEAESGMGSKDGVWVVSYPLMLPLADLIRQKLRDVAWERFVSQNKGDKADQIYSFVTSHEFIQQVEALAEIYNDMIVEVQKERAAFERIWRTREAQAQKLLKSTAGIWGSMRGFIGSSLPQLKGLDLPEPDKE